MKKGEFIEKIKIAAREVGARHSLRLMVLYGSHAKGMAKKNSDVDIAVLGEKALDLGQITDIINEFMDLLKINEVDVKSLHKTNPLFRWEVMERGILLYGDELDFVKFRAYAFRDYVDSKSLFDLKEKMVKKQIKNL